MGATTPQRNLELFKNKSMVTCGASVELGALTKSVILAHSIKNWCQRLLNVTKRGKEEVRSEEVEMA